jgi:cobalt-zinc-cadmium resistance protein CzcA
MRGTVVGQVYEHDTVFDVVVRAHSDQRRDPADLGRLLVDAPNGDKIPLSAVAQISVDAAPNVINHEAARRRLLVTCNAVNRDVESVVAEYSAAADIARTEVADRLSP